MSKSIAVPRDCWPPSFALAVAPLAQERFTQQSSGGAAAQGRDGPPRHGGERRSAGDPDRARRARARRQRGRCRGGGGVCPRGDACPRPAISAAAASCWSICAERNEKVAIDYRETAPAATTADIFLGPDGQVDPAKSRDTGLGVGVPGTVAGLALALDRYGSGKFTLAELIAPAVRLAREGVAGQGRPVRFAAAGPAAARAMARRRPRFSSSPTAARRLPGDKLVQSDLADTLETIGREGPRAFYVGPIADKIVAAVRDAGGVMIRSDLEKLSARSIRNPIYGTYRGYDVVSMPPPSSGGVALIEMLNILEGYPSHVVGSGSPAALHLQIEAMKLAYADRAAYLGDTTASMFRPIA